MSENSEKCLPKPKMTSSSGLFRPQLNNIQFTVIEEGKNTENIHISEAEMTLYLNKYSKRLIDYQNSCRLI